MCSVLGKLANSNLADPLGIGGKKGGEFLADPLDVFGKQGSAQRKIDQRRTLLTARNELAATNAANERGLSLIAAEKSRSLLGG